MSLTALSPLDGRYASQVQALSPYFSEWALMRSRLQVEIAWLTTLSAHPEFPHIRAMSAGEQQLLADWLTTFDIQQAQHVKAIETTTGHDVKALEYYLKDRLAGTSLADMREWVHFCCTSEDISNLAYARLLKGGMEAEWLPVAQRLVHAVGTLAEAHRELPMLTRTHGQPASPFNAWLGEESGNKHASPLRNRTSR